MTSYAGGKPDLVTGAFVMRRTFIAFGAACLGLLPGSGSAWTAWNSLPVNPVRDAVFEVVGQSGSANVDYWCAAGDYARRVLEAPLGQRIYIVRGRAEAETMARKSAVQFSLVAPGQAVDKQIGLLSVTQVGENISAAMAFDYCLTNKSLGG
ncbi:hypothetical protein I5535_06335 [Rhodobacteraceae bacterium F11138]|nr:hypothetical protein [Rhodobacteraceae bacterium F11138]